MRYITEGHYIIDTETNLAVAKSCILKGTNLIADAELHDQGKKFAVIITAALNMYNQNQGGL